MKSSYLIDVLALELFEELVQAIRISLNTDGIEDALDVCGGGGGVATEAEEEVGCEVLHLELVSAILVKVSMLSRLCG